MVSRKLDGLFELLFHGPYSLEDARKYWSYPPCKMYGKKHTQNFCEKDDSFIKELIETEINQKDQRENGELARNKISHLIEKHNINSMLDFGCGLGMDGVYYAKKFGIEVTFADISLSNVRLTERYAPIWDISANSKYIENSGTVDFGEKFDLIYSSGVLHHIPEPEPVVLNLRRFLKPGGIFVVMLYTEEHYKRKGAENLYHYATRSEAPAPINITNPYSEFYDKAKVEALFDGLSLIDTWTTNQNSFGWYCFE